MAEAKSWNIAEPDLETILAEDRQPLEALSSGEIPAIVIRNAYPAERCRQLIARLIEQELLYDPAKPVPEKFIEQAIPEGYYRDGKFHELARQNKIENVEVVLDPGDLYFFNTRSIHEVPGVAGELPRIVLATFIGYSADCSEIFVWS